MHLNDITFDANEISLGTVEGVLFLQRALTARSIRLNRSKRVALPQEGHVLTPEYVPDIQLCQERESASWTREGYRWLRYPSALARVR